MLRKAHKQQRQSIDKIYTQGCGSLLPRGTGPFGYAFHSPHATDIRSEIQKATASPQTPMSDLLQVAYSVFDNRDMVGKAELFQRNTQRAEMMIVALSTQRPAEGRSAFAGQAGHGGPRGPQVPRPTQDALCGQKGAGGETVADLPFYRQPGNRRRECPRHLRSMGPLGLGWFPNIEGPRSHKGLCLQHRVYN